MNDHDRLSDAELFGRAPQHFGLAARRGGVAADNALTPAVPRTIDAEDAKSLRAQPLGKRDAHIGEVSRGAMNEQRRAALFAARRPLNDVDRAAAYLDLLTLFNAPGLNGRERPERGEERGESGKGERHRRAISRLSGAEAVKAPDQPARP